MRLELLLGGVGPLTSGASGSSGVLGMSLATSLEACSVVDTVQAENIQIENVISHLSIKIITTFK